MWSFFGLFSEQKWSFTLETIWQHCSLALAVSLRRRLEAGRSSRVEDEADDGGGADLGRGLAVAGRPAPAVGHAHAEAGPAPASQEQEEAGQAASDHRIQRGSQVSTTTS